MKTILEFLTKQKIKTSIVPLQYEKEYKKLYTSLFVPNSPGARQLADIVFKRASVQDIKEYIAAAYGQLDVETFKEFAQTYITFWASIEGGPVNQQRLADNALGVLDQTVNTVDDIDGYLSYTIPLLFMVFLNCVIIVAKEKHVL